MHTNETDISRVIAEIIEDVAGVPRSEITSDKSLMEELDVDSLAVVEIGAAIFERLGVEIDDNEIKDVRTVGDLTEIIRRQLV